MFVNVIILVVLNWSYVRADCSDVPLVQNSSNNATGQVGPYQDGFKVEFTCDQGFQPEGTLIYTCEGSSWNGELICREHFCPAVDHPENGRIEGNPSYKVGTYVTFSCNEGYDLQGEKNILCRIDFQFDSSPPTCKVRMCPPFGDVANGRTSQATDDGILNDYGSVVRITCDDGYILDGFSSVTCKADRTWTTPPTCKAISCPHFPGMSSKCIDKFTLFETLYYMRCKTTVPNKRVAAPSDKAPNECLDDGTWLYNNFACYCYCKIQYDNTSISITNLGTDGYLPHNQTLSWTCLHGGRKNTTKDLVCNDGQMDQPVCLSAGCKVEYNSNSISISNLTPGGYLPHGHTLQWSCLHGGQKNTTGDLICRNGQMESPVCVFKSTTPKQNANDPNKKHSDPTNESSSVAWWVILFSVLVGVVGVALVGLGIFWFVRKRN